MVMTATTGGESAYRDRSKGNDVRTSNIVAAKAIASAVRTSLGPRGMDKLLQLPGGEVLISNDGATILDKMKVLHPAAKMLVELSKSQDICAGDGTTTVVVLAGALLEVCASSLLRSGNHNRMHPTVIASSLLKASEEACRYLTDHMARPVNLQDREALLAAVETCLSSKVVAQHTQLLAPIAVDSVLALAQQAQQDGDNDAQNEMPEDESASLRYSSANQNNRIDLRDIRLVEQLGGTVDDTELVQGGGFVLQSGANRTAGGGPTRVQNAKIALIQYCLSAPKTDMDNNVVVSDYAAMDRILREERKYILQQCKTIKKSGCNVLLIQKSILRDAYNELSLHFLAKMNILVVTDIERADVDFICRTTGCQPMALPDQCRPEKLGTAESVQDLYMEGGSNRVVKFKGVAHPGQTVTVLLRGGSQVVLAEAARSLHDAQCVVRNLVGGGSGTSGHLIAGGGAAETAAALHLKKCAATASGMTGPEARCFSAFAEALEQIPYTLAENAGMKPIQVVTELRAQHAAGHKGAGINVKKGKVVQDMYELNVVQPLLVTTSAIRLATETVALIMKIDDLVVVQ